MPWLRISTVSSRSTRRCSTSTPTTARSTSAAGRGATCWSWRRARDASSAPICLRTTCASAATCSRSCAATARCAREVHWMQTAGERLPFVDGAFDRVICTETLEHVDDDRVLARGAAARAEARRHPRRQRARRVLREGLLEAVEELPHARRRPRAHLPRGRTSSRLLRGAGLEPYAVRYRHSLETLYWLSHVAFWSEWGQQGPITRVFRRALDSTRARAIIDRQRDRRHRQPHPAEEHRRLQPQATAPARRARRRRARGACAGHERARAGAAARSRRRPRRDRSARGAGAVRNRRADEGAGERAGAGAALAAG